MLITLVGKMYLQEKGIVPQDFDAARKYLLIAARNGDAEACLAVGTFLLLPVPRAYFMKQGHCIFLERALKT